MSFFDDKTKAEVVARLAHLREPVRLIYFTQPHACGSCREQRSLLEELASLSHKLSLDVKDFVADDAEAKRYGIDKVPAPVVAGERDYRIRFYGVTAGYEFDSLVEAIAMISTGTSGLDPAIEALVQQIAVPVHLEVAVTLTCPYCPRMVRLAHQMAFLNQKIRADMVDAASFPALVERYDVTTVPKTIVNERPAFEGALPAASAVLEIVKAVDPAMYERLDAALREQRGERKATKARPADLFDVIVIGAGPAGLSAALYAVRKNRRVALISENTGGQINDTATIENYLGMTHIGGRELAEAFRNHVETYPVAERLHAAVASVRRVAETFEVATADGATYRARSVIYAAGKQYRRLGVPGEDRFLGHGIAFCATCDAPLFRRKRVAVVGGGNSAFTAVRDLLAFASEIHVVHMLSEFQADPILVAQAKNAPNVRFHFPSHVREFLGDVKLTGVRITGSGDDRYDLLVDGVFLEIGLLPNAAPVKGFVALNAAGEIPVGRDQSTNVPGFFAAGDVSDEPEKQIIVAAGAGARAALAADRFLSAIAGPARLQAAG
jgi:alkyl hydroperoxide reductase subunit F